MVVGPQKFQDLLKHSTNLFSLIIHLCNIITYSCPSLMTKAVNLAIILIFSFIEL